MSIAIRRNEQEQSSILTSRLDSPSTETIVVELQRSVGQVQLVDPRNELGSASGGGRDVLAVRTDLLARFLPCELDLAARVRESGAVCGDVGSVVWVGRVGVVGNVESGEVLPN